MNEEKPGLDVPLRLCLPLRVSRALGRAGILTPRDMVGLSEWDIIDTRGVGRSSLQLVKALMSGLGEPLAEEPPQPLISWDLITQQQHGEGSKAMNAEDYEQQAVRYARSDHAPLVNALLAVAATLRECTDKLLAAPATVSALEWDGITFAEEPTMDVVCGAFDEDGEALEQLKPGSIVDTARGEIFVKTDTGKWAQLPQVDLVDMIRSSDLVAWRVRIIWEA